MTVKARIAQAPRLGACGLAFGFSLGLAALGSAALGLSVLPLRAETHATAPDPAAESADLIQVATTLNSQLSDILTELDAEIALQEENAGFGASAETLAQIDGLIAHRSELAAKQAQVRALLATLRGTD
ncbi:hypothetical protein [Antarctobacter heliothermus]|uniref:Uncharacterized protein n=1 Tax=Antarctobacter heliothermus TaxID=74033 RepID=A0A239ED42_9RHOB|nr:hypothetical protein [Antarctobacter heliothermus]SNS42168.1 hypothetical protein SAMN04488078_101458 [Antarctobacter heliothermus]